MRHCVAKRSSKPGLVQSLLDGLVRHKKVRTTLARAKLIRPIFEKLITKARNSNGDLAGFRLLLSRLKSESLAKIVLSEICPMVGKRPGGYTRIMKLSKSRHGDASREAIIMLVDNNDLNGRSFKDISNTLHDARVNDKSEDAANSEESDEFVVNSDNELGGFE